MIGAAIKAMLALTGATHKALAEHLGITAQGLSGKFHKDNFTVLDLINAAEFFGCTLNFSFPEGHTITLNKPGQNVAGRSV